MHDHPDAGPGPSRRIAERALRYGRMARFRGYDRTARALFRLALGLAPDLGLARRLLDIMAPRPPRALAHLQFVAFGTTGLCNASCIHCPTGKAATAHVPRSTMPMEIFLKVIDGIVDERLAVISQMSFGLFGDGLVDPLVVERARHVRRKLPDVLLSVNTNGAAFNEARHAPLRELAGVIALHCESLDPAVFDRLMAPLRLKNVLPRYEALLRTFPGMIRVSVPVSRANLPELPDIRRWFMDRGAQEVTFAPLASRCAEDRGLFDTLALAPQRIRCTPAIMSSLIVDCDGLVLPCCNDFARSEPIGDLGRNGFRHVLRAAERAAFAQKLAAGAHDAVPLCSRCYADLLTSDFPYDQLPAGPAAA